jgi:sRNA-binding protein
MATRYPREHLENAIRYLAEKYPATFFEDPGMRRPLKATIAADLQKDGVDEGIIAGVSFYMNHFGYQRQIQAGADRVDLNGRKAGVVTELEQLNAQKKVREAKEEINNRKNGPVPSLRSSPAAGKTSGDDLSKVAAPVKRVSSTPESASVLARLQMLLGSADKVFAATEDEALRTALTLASLKLLVDEAHKVIATLEDQTHDN